MGGGRHEKQAEVRVRSERELPGADGEVGCDWRKTWVGARE